MSDLDDLSRAASAANKARPPTRLPPNLKAKRHIGWWALGAVVLAGVMRSPTPVDSPIPHAGQQSYQSPPAPRPARATAPTPDAPQINSGKTVHVSGYYRKDGTYVQPYDRRPPSR